MVYTYCRRCTFSCSSLGSIVCRMYCGCRMKRLCLSKNYWGPAHPYSRQCLWRERKYLHMRGSHDVEKQLMCLNYLKSYILTADFTQFLAVFEEIWLVRCAAGAKLLVPGWAPSVGIWPISTASSCEEMRSIHGGRHHLYALSTEER